MAWRGRAIHHTEDLESGFGHPAPTITVDDDSDGLAPPTDGASYRKKFSETRFLVVALSIFTQLSFAC
jgi:hypothetical protein